MTSSCVPWAVVSGNNCLFQTFSKPSVILCYQTTASASKYQWHNTNKRNHMSILILNRIVFKHTENWQVLQSCTMMMSWRGQTVQGWGLIKLCSLISPLHEIWIYQNHRLATLNYIHICQVSVQLSCGDTCQIWTWYFTGNLCFDDSGKIRKIMEWRKLT